MKKKKDREFYAFEDFALLNTIGITLSDNYLPETEIKTLVSKISQSYGMPAPLIKRTRKDSRRCYYWVVDHSIYLNELFGHTLVFVLHEICHAICYQLYPEHTESHGKEFTTVWIEVMSRMFEVNPNVFKKIADQRHIEYI